MKSYKLFQICYTVNFIMCLIIIGYRIYVEFVQSNFSFSIHTSFIIICGITSLFAIFDWFCYNLIHSIKMDLPLSDKRLTKGKFLKNICLLLSGIFSLAIVVKIIDSQFHDLPMFYDIKGYPLWYIFLLLFATTFYLSIAYGMMLKHRHQGIADTIEKIGAEE